MKGPKDWAGVPRRRGPFKPRTRYHLGYAPTRNFLGRVNGYVLVNRGKSWKGAKHNTTSRAVRTRFANAMTRALTTLEAARG